MGASWKPLYKRNNFHERRLGARKALMFTEFTRNDGAQLVKESLAKTRFQERTEKATRAPGHIHDRFSHRVTAFEFGMIWETLDLTAEELQPAKIEKPKTTARLHGARSRYQRETKSLIGVG
jgi:hypothetical protein